jgi:hypothetical protein
MMAFPACVRALRVCALAGLCALCATLLPTALGALGLPEAPTSNAPRPLHQIAAGADAIAIGTIGPVSESRIRVYNVIDVTGAVPAEFDVKRAPSNAPLFHTGDHAVLLLRGARSPYLLVDDPTENIVFPAAGEVEWILALRSFADARHDPAQLEGLYFAWIDGNNPALRTLALRGLADSAAPFHPITQDLLTDRAHRAVDPGTRAEVRKASADIALLSPESAAHLLHEVLQPSSAVDPDVYETALQGATLQRGDALEFNAALDRGLRSVDVAVRTIAVRYAMNARDPALTNQVEKLAVQDPDPGVRKAAAQALAAKRAP